jgi:hypothetical protein
MGPSPSELFAATQQRREYERRTAYRQGFFVRCTKIIAMQ